ncbi:hypothetical protein KHA96_02590 [Bacillus sp. FJAT-49711]|uniref:hypothetical protein n=1 Tax=Bacillus sp. FJAT-49711 TaxID=2833585 RepID=UPI001BC94D80|nr:hypothetical protein [Bacillus sp. FJAT-49711]MBS4217199.1 hypothetical protein [Bacillus sp. FJAT-49711]
MKKQLWLIIFFYVVLLAGCSLFFNHFILNDKAYNMTVELNEIQHNNGIRITLYKVSYSYEWNEQRIYMSFKLDNQANSPAVLTGLKTEDTTDNILQLKNAKEKFQRLVAYGWNDEVGKEEDDVVTFSFPAKMDSSFEAGFVVDNELLDGLKCHIPLFINNEKVEFIFPIPSPREIED